jgi:hypothetical protein
MKYKCCLFLLIVFVFIFSGCYNNKTNESKLSEANDNSSRIEYIELIKAQLASVKNRLLNFYKIDDVDVSLFVNEKNIAMNVTLTINDIVSDDEVDRLVLLISNISEIVESEDIYISDQDGNNLYPKEP